MTITTPTNLRKNLFKILDSVIKFNETVTVVTKEGNAVLISEEDYNGMLATVEIYKNPKLKNKIIEGLNTPISEAVNEKEIDW